MEHKFVHLHVHSEYSLLDGMGKIKDIVRKVKNSGMDACAITDHGAGYGLVEFYDTCKQEGIKPILGCEFYEAPGSRFKKNAGRNDDKYYHLILLVKNETGYKNLCRLISRSNTEGFYYKPRIDWELLEKYHDGLVCLSACIAGRIPQAIISGDMKKAEEEAKKYKDLFGDDYYLEIQNHGIPAEAAAAHGMVLLGKKLDIKLVCTNDCHYVESDDKEAHEWLLCLQTGKTIQDENRMQYFGDYSVKTEEEMRKLFPSLPDAFDNTVEIAQKCNFDFEYGNYRMPKVHIPEEYGNDCFKYLSDEAWKGLDARYPVGNPERETAMKDLEYELGVIKEMNFAEYFIDTRKTVLWAKDHGILVGPGRGSAAGSRMCYCLGITDIDPIPYDLLFERFLNPERVSMPDIDVDYDYSHKDDVIAFEADSNGKENFAKIQTFGTMQAKGILRDMARVAGYPPSVGDALAKMIPVGPDVTLEEAAKANKDLLAYVHENRLEKLWDIAKRLEGTKKSAGTHACGHIPTPVPCEELFPVSVDKDTGYLICQYNMTQAEHLGNLKKDLLMLRNLTIIDMTHKLVKEEKGIDIPLWTDEILNNKAALDMIADGNTNGVFQLESEGMKDFMKHLKPSCFEDIIAGVALYRPGPMDFIPKYIEGKHNPDSVTYLTPELEPILKPTYGVIVYQEQVMQIVRSLAGFSMGRADILRRAMSKKKQDVMDRELQNFMYGNEELGIPGCKGMGISESVAKEIYNQMIDFAKYAFNKSHAACYAAISMQTAYLKANYPLEFASGLLSSVMDKTDKLALYVNEYQRNGYEILPPDVNTSDLTFTVEDGKILYGLSAVKDVGKAAEALVEERKHGEYAGFMDFIKRNAENLNRKEAEALIKSGAMDFTGCTRYSMLQVVGSKLDDAKKDKRSQAEGQMSLLDFMPEDSEEREWLTGELEIHKCKIEFTDKDLISMEKEALGFYLTSHPLDEYEEYMRKNGICDSSALLPDDNGLYPNWLRDGLKVAVAGMVLDIHTITTKKGDPMAFVTIEDGIASTDIVMFPKVFDEYRHFVKKDEIIEVHGRVSFKENGISILADSFKKPMEPEPPKDKDIMMPEPIMPDTMMPAPARPEPVMPERLMTEPKVTHENLRHIWVRMDNDTFRFNSAYLSFLCRNNPGNDIVYVYIADVKQKIASKDKTNFEAIEPKLIEFFGKDNVKTT